MNRFYVQLQEQQVENSDTIPARLEGRATDSIIHTSSIETYTPTRSCSCRWPWARYAPRLWPIQYTLASKENSNSLQTVLWLYHIDDLVEVDSFEFFDYDYFMIMKASANWYILYHFTSCYASFLGDSHTLTSRFFTYIIPIRLYVYTWFDYHTLTSSS